MNKTESSDSTQKNKRTKQKQRMKFSITEKVALFGLIGAIVGAMLSSPIVQCWLQPYTCESPPPTFTFTPTLTPTPTFTFTPTLTPTPTFTSTPSLTPTPAISILDAQSTDSKPINKNFAPYDVLVSGNMSNAKGLYLYLIVDDTNKKWVQNPFGVITGDTFTVLCYLGDSPTSLIAQNKSYIIYAVITNNGLYKEGDNFTGEGLIVKSNEIVLVRKDLPTPIP